MTQAADAFAEKVRDYLEVLTATLEETARADMRLPRFAAALRAIDAGALQRGPLPKLEHPAMAFLPEISATAGGPPALAKAARSAIATVDWTETYGGGGMDPALADNMLAAQVAGGYGAFAAAHVATGLFLLAPGLRYPLHTHAAEELYFCVSGAVTLQHGVEGDPFTVRPGDYSITPPHRLHSLEVGAEPSLLLYLWIGELPCPLWLWRPDGEGGWRREQWERDGGAPWRIVSSEVVTDAVMAQAHG